MSARVVSLHVYPVKSLRGLDLHELALNEDGPEGDREFVVVDDTGKFLTQRQLPEMQLISVRKTAGELVLSADGVSVSASLKGESDGQVVVWGETLHGRHLSGDVDLFLSKRLGRAVKLYGYQPAHPRRRKSNSSGAEFETRYSDQAQVLLTTMESLRSLSGFVNRDLEMARFRANIVIEGVPAWSEESWTRLRVGGVELEVMRLCTRCKIITINPRTAVMGDTAPLEALKAVKGPRAKMEFGLHCRVVTPGSVRIGDAVAEIAVTS